MSQNLQKGLCFKFLSDFYNVLCSITLQLCLVQSKRKKVSGCCRISFFHLRNWETEIKNPLKSGGIRIQCFVPLSSKCPTGLVNGYRILPQNQSSTVTKLLIWSIRSMPWMSCSETINRMRPLRLNCKSIFFHTTLKDMLLQNGRNFFISFKTMWQTKKLRH